MSFVLCVSPNGNHKKIKVVSLNDQSTWSDLFVKVAHKLSIKPKRVFYKNGTEVDIDTVALSDVKKCHLYFSDGANFVGFKQKENGRVVPKKAIRMEMGSIAYLTKPAKYDFTIFYDDGTHEPLITTEEEANRIAKEYRICISDRATKSDSESGSAEVEREMY